MCLCSAELLIIAITSERNTVQRNTSKGKGLAGRAGGFNIFQRRGWKYYVHRRHCVKSVKCD